MAREREDGPRGILDPETFARHVDLKRFLPGERLAPYVEHYWRVAWDLPHGASYLSQNLPYPSVHLVFEPDCAYVQGVTTSLFSYRVEVSGSVFSVKFLPGMFYPFFGRPLRGLTDARVQIDEVFGAEGMRLAEAVRANGEVNASIALLEGFLDSRLVPPARLSATPRAAKSVLESCARSRRIVEYIAANRDVTKVRSVEEQFAIRPASLQLLFRRYVGVGAKWVIRRFRMIEAVEALHPAPAASGENDRTLERAGDTLAGLALELGYSDQSHFTNDFRAMTGRTPAAYSGGSRDDPRP